MLINIFVYTHLNSLFYDICKYCDVYLRYTRLHNNRSECFLLYCQAMFGCHWAHEAYSFIMFNVFMINNVLVYCPLTMYLHLLYHSSSGASGEEEKGQSQEVDQKVSCAYFSFSINVFFFS